MTQYAFSNRPVIADAWYRLTAVDSHTVTSASQSDYEYDGFRYVGIEIL